MSSVSIFVAILLLAIAGVTYTLMRLAPSSAPLPRGAVAAVRIIRGIGEHADIVSIISGAILALAAVVWIAVTYPALLAVAAIGAVIIAIAIFRS